MMGKSLIIVHVHVYMYMYMYTCIYTYEEETGLFESVLERVCHLA